MPARNRAGAWLLLPLLVLPLLVLTGCSAAPAPTIDSPAPTTVAVDAAVDLEDYPDLASLPNGTVIATGSFTGAPDAAEPGSVTGTVEITKDNNLLTVALRGLDVGESIRSDKGVILELNALAEGATPDEFRLARGQLGDGTGLVEARAARQQEFTLEQGWMSTTDPSWMRTAVIWQQVDGRPYGQVLATAGLTWTLPDLNPDLAVLDTGAVDHASGEVIYDSAGDPSGYVVASGDNLSSIAARFSVAWNDLDWLNPMRGSTEAQTGETLNLSRYERGR